VTLVNPITGRLRDWSVRAACWGPQLTGAGLTLCLALRRRALLWIADSAPAKLRPQPAAAAWNAALQQKYGGSGEVGDPKKSTIRNSGIQKTGALPRSAGPEWILRTAPSQPESRRTTPKQPAANQQAAHRPIPAAMGPSWQNSGHAEVAGQGALRSPAIEGFGPADPALLSRRECQSCVWRWPG